MANVRRRKETGLLFLDFWYRGTRCREQTTLPDTPANRERLQSLAGRIERAISRGTFRYVEFFPSSPRVALDGSGSAPATDAVVELGRAPSQPQQHLPTFAEFAETWFKESEPRWRKRYRESVRVVLDKDLLPALGTKRLDAIDRGDLLAFRAQIAKRRGRAGRTLSAKRINKLMTHLNAILNEGCDRYSVASPARGIKPLKQKRTDVQPFSLEEVQRLITTVREDYRPYLTVRCFTGLRTGEANGLQWTDVDFSRNTIRVNRSESRNGDGQLKTDFSHREIPMVPQVRAAIEEQRKRSIEGCPWLFHSIHGHPVDEVNFTNRIWYPLLRYLGMPMRPPYQMRHTAATLMLASGENPEWVARVLGHATTDMLFRVYSRFVPNVTRQDGLAYTGLVTAGSRGAKPVLPSGTEIESLDAIALRRLLKQYLGLQDPPSSSPASDGR